MLHFPLFNRKLSVGRAINAKRSNLFYINLILFFQGFSIVQLNESNKLQIRSSFLKCYFKTEKKTRPRRFV